MKKKFVTPIVALLVLISLTSCKQEQKIDVDACMIIYELGVGFCINSITREERDIPLEEMNKYTCFSPEDWGKIRYRLRREARNKADFQREFDSIIKWQSQRN